MTRCPAHVNRIQRTPSRAVNQIDATHQPECRRTAIDFQFDQTMDGRTLKFLNVIDEYSRLALAIRE